jgi:hypothetical protein
MGVYTQDYVGTLSIIDCGECGVTFGLTSGFVKERKRSHQTFYCPNGHARYWPDETEEERYKRLYHAAERRAGSNYDLAMSNERKLRATKGVVTKLRKHTLGGECPLCGQTLRDLKRHISRVHPDEQVEVADE